MSNIHQTAIVSSEAKIGNDVIIGPYSVIGSGVTIGDNVEIKSHVVIEGNTTIGSGNIFYPFCSIGTSPQDLKYKGEASKLVMGDNNTIREHVTINPGTAGGGLLTQIGNNCLFMMASHIAHDCILGDNIIMANNATLAGHVKIDDFAVIGGLSAIHQFVRIGRHAMIGGMAAIDSDIIPYGVAMNERASIEGINLVGLKRRGFTRESINAIKHIYNYMFFEDEDKTFAHRVENMANIYKNNEEVMILIDFLKTSSDRAICRPKNAI
jgi:UDP-N-acetylglucosamine acyltransferase